MTKAKLEKFVNYLKKENWLIFGPTESPPESTEPQEISPYLTAHSPPLQKVKTAPVFIDQIDKASDLILDSRLPFYSFKRFFIPEQETLFEYRSNSLKEKGEAHKIYPERSRGIALLGINILDLKAVNLYDQVFEKDPYYQKRRRQILIVGHAAVPENIFQDKFEEDILEHLPFDIFLADNDKQFKVFTGSIKGQRILEHFGYKNYEHIQFSGLIKEGEPDQQMVKLRENLKNKHNQKIWDELGKICIECGKCTIACPTCFCFRIDDEAKLGQTQGRRQRCWDSCYYQEFSEVSGEHKFLNTTAQRIHFWYFHKFARIPDEFGFMGCVGCHRCAKVCPVGIDIVEVLNSIKES